MNIHNTLQNIPFFSHLTNNEIRSLAGISETRPVPKDKKIDIKKAASFGVVIDGMFEPGTRIKGETVYLTPGSFFGEIPFTISRQSGILKATKDSVVILIKPEEMYKIFLLSFKGLRGYIKSIQRNGFEVDVPGNRFIKCKGKVITVFSPYRNSGNSIFSAMLGLTLSKYGKTIILDASYEGNSVFNILDKNPPPALSQKTEDKVFDDNFTGDRMVHVNENLSLLNIAYGSRVKINPCILSPAIFILSNSYEYIIIDHSDHGKDFTEGIMGVSDIILPVIKDIKDKPVFHNIFDSVLKDGQRVYYILNRFYAKNIGSFEGGYIFENLEIDSKGNIYPELKNRLDNNIPELFGNLSEIITGERRGLVVQPELTKAVFLSGFFSLLYEKDAKIDMVYTSAWSYLIAALFVLSGDQKEFEDNFFRLFAEDRIGSMLEITFPEEYIYKNTKINNFAFELSGDKRLEHNTILPAASISGLSDHGISSTGYMTDIFTASFLTGIFEPKKIVNSHYFSGFPFNYAKPEDLLRTDINEIRCILIDNKQKLNFGEKKVSQFFRGYIDSLYNDYNYAGMKTENDFFIEPDNDKYDLKEILNSSKEVCRNFK